MLHKGNRKKLIMIFIVSSGAVLLLLVLPERAQAKPRTALQVNCQDFIRIYRPYNGVDRMIYLLGVVVAPEITNRARIEYSLPPDSLSKLEKQELLKHTSTRIGISLPGLNYYAAVAPGIAPSLLGDPNLLDFSNDANATKVKLSLVVPTKPMDYGTHSDGESDAHRVIYWRPNHAIPNKQPEHMDPRLMNLIEKGVFEADTLERLIQECLKNNTLVTESESEKHVPQAQVYTPIGIGTTKSLTAPSE